MSWIPIVLLAAGMLLLLALWDRAWELVHAVHRRWHRRPPSAGDAGKTDGEHPGPQ